MIEDGGPTRLGLLGIRGPDGWIVTTVTASLEIGTRQGSSVPLDPTFIVPTPLAWGWRLGRWAGVPVISSIEPAKLRASVGLPGA